MHGSHILVFWGLYKLYIFILTVQNNVPINNAFMLEYDIIPIQNTTSDWQGWVLRTAEWELRHTGSLGVSFLFTKHIYSLSHPSLAPLNQHNFSNLVSRLQLWFLSFDFFLSAYVQIRFPVCQQVLFNPPCYTSLVPSLLNF